MQDQNKQTSEQKLSQLMDGEWHELNPSECVAALCKDDSLRAKWSRYHMIRDIMKNEPVAADQNLASRICAAIDDEPSYTNITALNTHPAASEQTTANSADTSTTVSAEQDSHQVEQLTARSAALMQAPVESAAPVESGRGGASEAKNDSMFKTGLTGFALAASVALVTVVGMNIWQSQSTNQIQSVASVSPQSAPVANEIRLQPVANSSLPEIEFVSNTGSYWVSPETTERSVNEQRLNMMLSQHFENSPTADREGLLPYSRLIGYDELGSEQ